MTLKPNANSRSRFEDWADEGINMLDLKIDLNMDTNSSFSLGSQSLSYSSSCPSTAGSFSSPSSHFDPLTPTSRTSTPQQPMNYDTSLDNDSMIFDFTPPSSATSAYFPLDMKHTVTPDMLNHGMPSTPSRCNNLFDTTLSFHDSLNYTPTRDMDAYNFVDVLGSSSPFLVPTPPPQFSSNTPNCDLASVWGQHADSSPITFSSPAVPLTARTSTPMTSSHSNMRRRVVMDGPQHSSAMLQQHLQTPTKAKVPKSRSTGVKAGTSGQRGYRVSKSLDRIPPRKHKCDLCNGKVYSRAEHLKRHKTEMHSNNPTKWVCEFCEPKPKVFGRSDNFRDHLRRHCAKNSAGSRTKQKSGAAALLAKMESEMKTKKRRATKADSEEMTSPMDDLKAEPQSPPLSSPLL